LNADLQSEELGFEKLDHPNLPESGGFINESGCISYRNGMKLRS
jgi:hypothetical protein